MPLLSSKASTTFSRSGLIAVTRALISALGTSISGRYRPVLMIVPYRAIVLLPVLKLIQPKDSKDSKVISRPAAGEPPLLLFAIL
jgi:hypothetical protein